MYTRSIIIITVGLYLFEINKFINFLKKKIFQLAEVRNVAVWQIAKSICLDITVAISVPNRLDYYFFPSISKLIEICSHIQNTYCEVVVGNMLFSAISYCFPDITY